MLHGENKYREHQATGVRLLPVKEDDGSCGIHAAESCCWQAARMVLQGGEILITEFAYTGSRFARMCGFFWRFAHFSSARTDGGSGSGAGIDSGSGSGSGQGAGSIQSVRRFTENGRLPVEAAKYLPSAVCRRNHGASLMSDSVESQLLKV